MRKIERSVLKDNGFGQENSTSTCFYFLRIKVVSYCYKIVHEMSARLSQNRSTRKGKDFTTKRICSHHYVTIFGIIVLRCEFTLTHRNEKIICEYHDFHKIDHAIL